MVEQMTHDSSGSDLVEIRFDGLISGEADYPPVDTEFLWARPLSSLAYVLDNVPFYVRGIAYMDTVEAMPSAADGVLDFSRVLERSGHSTYRIIWFKASADAEKEREGVLNLLEKRGCSFERAGTRLYAIDLPPGVNVNEIYELLEQKEAQNLLGFEEGFYYSPTANT
jgi:hypothetical protein